VTPRPTEQALEELHELVDDVHLGPVAETALSCVALHGADPRMLLAAIEAAQDGGIVPLTKAERQRQWREQKITSERSRILSDRGGAL
jgi:hypothetical protein